MAVSLRRPVSGARTCRVERMLATLPGPFPAVPAQGEGAGGRGSASVPVARGKFLRKVKAALARLPEIPDVWALAWEGPENNVGALVAGRTLPQFLSAAWNTGCRRDPEPRAPALASMAWPETQATARSEECHPSNHLPMASWELRASSSHSTVA